MGGFDYPYDFSYEAEGLFEGAGAGFLDAIMVIYALMLLFAFSWAVVSYVFQSLGYYTIASRRGIHHSWLAWVPFGNLWIVGSISDQYQYVTKGKVKNRRKLLLGLSIGLFAGYFLWLFATVINLVVGQEGAAILILIFGILAIFAVAILLAVFQYMALYDLYSSCDPNNAVLYLVLSILFSGIVPFFVFACRKRDSGMPPRKQPEPQQVVVPTVEVVVDPTVVEKVVVPTVEPVLEEGFASPEEFEEE